MYNTKVFFACALLFVVCLASAVLQSAELPTLPELRADLNSFRENFDEAVPVTGNIVVGLRMGNGSGKVSAENTFLAPPAGMNVCVRAVTKDGRFSASNVYRFASPEHVSLAATVGKAHLLPVTRNYKENLSQYAIDDLAVSAFTESAQGCIPGATPYLPQIITSAPEAAVLTIFVNSGGRTSRLTHNASKTIIQCNPLPDGARIAYNQKCVVAAARLNMGINNFTLVLDDDFKDETVDFSVVIPANKP